MGNALALLTEDQITEIKQRTVFDETDLAHLLKRYSELDSSEKAAAGIAIDDIATIPEFCTNSLIPRVAAGLAGGSDKHIYPEQFVYLCAALSSRTSYREKLKWLFRSLDVDGQSGLQHEELFSLYQTLYRGVLSENQIIAQVLQILQSPLLSIAGVITETDFMKLVSDWELDQHFTNDLQVPP